MIKMTFKNRFFSTLFGKASASPSADSSIGSAHIETEIPPQTDIITATVQRDISALQKSIAEGADINRAGASGDNALMLAAVENDAEIVDILIQAGADLNRKNRHGATALILAAAVNADKTVTQLLDAKANPFIRDRQGKTALDYARDGGYFDSVALLEGPKAERDKILKFQP